MPSEVALQIPGIAVEVGVGGDGDHVVPIVLRNGFVALADGSPGEQIVGFVLKSEMKVKAESRPTRFSRNVGADWGT